MIDLQAYLEKKLRDVMSAWNEADIYAISFFVYANETYEYDGYSNITQFSVSYNTERDCDSAGNYLRNDGITLFGVKMKHR